MEEGCNDSARLVDSVGQIQEGLEPSTCTKGQEQDCREIKQHGP